MSDSDESSLIINDEYDNSNDNFHLQKLKFQIKIQII